MTEEHYRAVTTKYRGEAPSKNAFFVDKPASRGSGTVAIAWQLIHGADAIRLMDDAEIGEEVTFRLMAWKAEEIGFA